MKKKSIIYLMYHDVYSHTPDESGVSEVNASMYKMSISLFERHVEHISKYIETHRLSPNAITMTFDDGGLSFYNQIAPVLERYGLKGLFFIATDFIGKTGFMNASQIRELSNRGHLVASHSHTHPENMSKLSYEECFKDWEKSISILEVITGKTINIASIPNGDSSIAVIKAASAAGIKTLYTSEPTSNTKKKSDLNLIGRFVVYGDSSISDLDKILTSSQYRLRLKIRYEILMAAHKALGRYYSIIKNLFLKIKD